MKDNISVVAFPMSHEIPLSHLLQLLSEIVDKVYVISGGVALEKVKFGRNIFAFNVTHRVSSNIFMRIINYLKTQLKMLGFLIPLLKNVDTFIFFIGGEFLILPLLFLRILRKKIKNIHRGTFGAIVYEVGGYKRIFPNAKNVLEMLREKNQLYPDAEELMGFELE